MSFLPGLPDSWVELLRGYPDGYFWLDLHGALGETYDLEVSSDLQSWAPQSRFKFDYFNTVFQDPDFNAPARFYRMRKVTLVPR